jgi:hypothetical protein
VKANVGVVSEVFGNQWNWSCFHNKQKSMLGLFPKFWKLMNFSWFHNEQKPNVEMFSKGFKNHWITKTSMVKFSQNFWWFWMLINLRICAYMFGVIIVEDEIIIRENFYKIW